MDNYNIIQNFHNTLKMLIFDKLKTNNVVIDTILTTLIISLFGTCLSFINRCDKSSIYNYICNMRFVYNAPNKIIISGKNCTSPSSFGDFYISAAYSDGFNALLDYIMKNIDKSKSSNIREIKELYSNSNNLNR
jgi:hypothetical protein